MKKIIILLFPFFSFFAHSQEPDNEALKQIKLLREKGVDTIVRFDNEYFRVPQKYRIQGLDYVSIVREIYLFYRFQGEAWVQKCIFYGDTSSNETYMAATLDPLKIGCDSLLAYASYNFEKMRQEKIYPFIYQTKHEKDTSFVWFQNSYPTNFYIQVWLKKEIAGGSIMPENIEPSALDGKAINLNYTYNTSTSIYKVFLMAKELIQPIQRKFIYTIK